jgi:hypothetical protein
MPEKRFDSVSCRASATARPPTPRAVSIGAMEIPRDCRMIRRPTMTTRARVRFTNMEVDSSAPPTLRL